jgi:hypothetical protein
MLPQKQQRPPALISFDVFLAHAPAHFKARARKEEARIPHYHTNVAILREFFDKHDPSVRGVATLLLLEYCSGGGHARAEKKNKLEKLEKKVRAQIRKMFVAMDSDGDGIITREEQRAFYRESGADLLDEKVLVAMEAAWAKVDVNHDGRISYDEFEALQLPLMVKRVHEQREEKRQAAVAYGDLLSMATADGKVTDKKSARLAAGRKKYGITQAQHDQLLVNPGALGGASVAGDMQIVPLGVDPFGPVGGLCRLRADLGRAYGVQPRLVGRDGDDDADFGVSNRAAIKIQALVRARRDRLRLVKEISEQNNSALARPGTVQGKSGYYEIWQPSKKRSVIARFDVDEEGDWKLVEGPFAKRPTMRMSSSPYTRDVHVDVLRHLVPEDVMMRSGALGGGYLEYDEEGKEENTEEELELEKREEARIQHMQKRIHQQQRLHRARVPLFQCSKIWGVSATMLGGALDTHDVEGDCDGGYFYRMEVFEDGCVDSVATGTGLWLVVNCASDSTKKRLRVEESVWMEEESEADDIVAVKKTKRGKAEIVQSTSGQQWGYRSLLHSGEEDSADRDRASRRWVTVDPSAKAAWKYGRLQDMDEATKYALAIAICQAASLARVGSSDATPNTIDAAGVTAGARGARLGLVETAAKSTIGAASSAADNGSASSVGNGMLRLEVKRDVLIALLEERQRALEKGGDSTAVTVPAVAEVDESTDISSTISSSNKYAAVRVVVGGTEPTDSFDGFAGGKDGSPSSKEASKVRVVIVPPVVVNPPRQRLVRVLRPVRRLLLRRRQLEMGEESLVRMSGSFGFYSRLTFVEEGDSDGPSSVRIFASLLRLRAHPAGGNWTALLTARQLVDAGLDDWASTDDGDGEREMVQSASRVELCECLARAVEWVRLPAETIGYWFHLRHERGERGLSGVSLDGGSDSAGADGSPWSGVTTGAANGNVGASIDARIDAAAKASTFSTVDSSSQAVGVVRFAPSPTLGVLWSGWWAREDFEGRKQDIYKWQMQQSNLRSTFAPTAVRSPQKGASVAVARKRMAAGSPDKGVGFTRQRERFEVSEAARAAAVPSAAGAGQVALHMCRVGLHGGDDAGSSNRSTAYVRSGLQSTEGTYLLYGRTIHGFLFYRKPHTNLYILPHKFALNPETRAVERWDETHNDDDEDTQVRVMWTLCKLGDDGYIPSLHHHPVDQNLNESTFTNPSGRTDLLICHDVRHDAAPSGSDGDLGGEVANGQAQGKHGWELQALSTPPQQGWRFTTAEGNHWEAGVQRWFSGGLLDCPSGFQVQTRRLLLFPSLVAEEEAAKAEAAASAAAVAAKEAAEIFSHTNLLQATTLTKAGVVAPLAVAEGANAAALLEVGGQRKKTAGPKAHLLDGKASLTSQKVGGDSGGSGEATSGGQKKKTKAGPKGHLMMAKSTPSSQLIKSPSKKRAGPKAHLLISPLSTSLPESLRSPTKVAMSGPSKVALVTMPVKAVPGPSTSSLATHGAWLPAPAARPHTPVPQKGPILVGGADNTAFSTKSNRSSGPPMGMALDMPTDSFGSSLQRQLRAGPSAAGVLQMVEGDDVPLGASSLTVMDIDDHEASGSGSQLAVGLELMKVELPGAAGKPGLVIEHGVWGRLHAEKVPLQLAGRSAADRNNAAASTRGWSAGGSTMPVARRKKSLLGGLPPFGAIAKQNTDLALEFHIAHGPDGHEYLRVECSQPDLYLAENGDGEGGAGARQLVQSTPPISDRRKVKKGSNSSQSSSHVSREKEVAAAVDEAREEARRVVTDYALHEAEGNDRELSRSLPSVFDTQERVQQRMAKATKMAALLSTIDLGLRPGETLSSLPAAARESICKDAAARLRVVKLPPMLAKTLVPPSPEQPVVTQDWKTVGFGCEFMLMVEDDTAIAAAVQLQSAFRLRQYRRTRRVADDAAMVLQKYARARQSRNFSCLGDGGDASSFTATSVALTAVSCVLIISNTYPFLVYWIQ